jgi:purine nucleoside phosphorylase
MRAVAAGHHGEFHVGLYRGNACVTNMAAEIGGKLDHEEVLETGAAVRHTLVKFLRAVVPLLAQDEW